MSLSPLCYRSQLVSVRIHVSKSLSSAQLCGLALDEFKLCVGTNYVSSIEPRELSALTKPIGGSGLYDNGKVQNIVAFER
jgi:hypothetical protein